MRAVDIIMKKRNNEKLTQEEIKFFIDGYTKGSIEDYQMSALAMAIYFQSMDDEEATYLTKAMLETGDVIDLSKINGVKVDKHSTGGVGDKTSLVVAPLVASIGIKFAKMSGRGLGHTGGTLDKLESIPGYNIELTEDEFIKQVNNIGIALIGQTLELVPADKKLYALRDVTATVESIPLIASSIMSKKLASGADVICLDVKVGSGAFMKNIEEATKLGKLMVEIGKKCGKKMTAVLTNMDEPLGFAVGNSLEVIEAINTLNGNGPKDFTNLCLEIASHLIFDANYASSLEEAKQLCLKQIENREGLQSLANLVSHQGGDASYIFNPTKFEKAKYIIEVKAASNGYIKRIDALTIGHAAMLLGAGRQTIKDKICHSVGIVLNKKVGDYVNNGDTLLYIHTNFSDNKEIIKNVLQAYCIQDEACEPQLILKVIK